LPCCPWWRTSSTPWLLSSGMLQCCGRLCPHPVNKGFCLGLLWAHTSLGQSSQRFIRHQPWMAMALWGSGYPAGRPRDVQDHSANCWELDSSLQGLQVLLSIVLQSLAKMLRGMASTSTGCHTSSCPLFFVSWLLLLGHQMQNVHLSTVLSWVWKI
jgi:hypothetical protein